jgi:hypothetical protein
MFELVALALAGAGGTLIAAPVIVMLPIVGAGTAIALGGGVSTAVALGVKDMHSPPLPED